MVSIRLRREGTKNSPYYRVVVADQRSPRDGKFIEQVGVYDPRKAGELLQAGRRSARLLDSQGAQPSDTVPASCAAQKPRPQSRPPPLPAPATE